MTESNRYQHSVNTTFDLAKIVASQRHTQHLYVDGKWVKNGGLLVKTNRTVNERIRSNEYYRVFLTTKLVENQKG